MDAQRFAEQAAQIWNGDAARQNINDLDRMIRTDGAGNFHITAQVDEEAPVILPPPTGYETGYVPMPAPPPMHTTGATGRLRGAETNGIYRAATNWEHAPVTWTTTANRPYHTITFDEVGVTHAQYQCIPPDHPAVRFIMEIVPQVLHDAVWLGGSSVTCFGEHGDVDAWIGHADRMLSPVETRLSRSIIRTPGNTRGNEDLDEEYDDMACRMLCSMDAPDGTHIHIMEALHPMREVVEMFDISTHARVFRVMDLRAGAPGFISALGLTPRPYVRICNVRNARVTLARGIKFAKRYGDDSFWENDATRRCAAEAFGARVVPNEIVERMELLNVSEGL